MVFTINGEDYILKTSLGVAYDIETTKKTKIVNLVQKDMGLDEMIEIMYYGYKKGGNEGTVKDFKSKILDSDDFGYVDLQKEFVVFCNLLMSTKKTEDEIRKELDDRFNKELEKAEEELNNEKN